MIGELTTAQKARRKKILNTATTAFAEVGFYVADLDKIAREAGVGKGTLYNYFKNKEDLFLNCIEDHYEKTLSFIDSKIAQVNSCEAFIKKYIAAFIEYHSENHVFMDLIIHSNTSILNEVLDTLDRVKQKYYLDFRSKLEASANSSLNPQLVLLALDAAITSLLYRHFKLQKFDMKEIENTLTTLFLKGFLNSK